MQNRTTMPKKGDKVKVWVTRPRPNGEKVCPNQPWGYLRNTCYEVWGKRFDREDAECRCEGNDRMSVEEDMLIEKIMWFADNSIEAHGHLVSDGQRWHVMLEAPHGDACF